MKRIKIPLIVFLIVFGIVVILFVFTNSALFNANLMERAASQKQFLGFAPIKSLISKDCNGQCHALVFVEKEISNKIQNSLNTWEQDVFNEFNAATSRILVENDTTAEDIKNTIWSYENKRGQDVFVILFIGNIPYMDAYASTDTDENSMSQSQFPSDILFTDHKNRCTYNPAFDAYNIHADFGCQFAIDELPFVVGRLRPYGSTATRISLINSYFQRNHIHRTSSNNYGSGNGSMLINITLPFTSEIIDDMTSRLGWLFRPFRVMSPVTHSDDAAYKGQLLENYSVVYFNGHGGPRFHEYGMTPEILREIKPSPLYYSLKSCNVGNIAVDDDLASAYLFSGNGLFVYSNSISVLAGAAISRDIYYLMKGVPIYKYYSKFVEGNYTIATILMGDPTLSIRKKANSTKVPNIKIKPFKLDFGQISLADFTGDILIREYEWRVSNNSTKPIYIDERAISTQFISGSYDSLSAIAIIPRLNSNYTLSAAREPFSAEFGVKINANSKARGTILLSLERPGIMAASQVNRKFNGKLVISMYSEKSGQIYILDVPFKGEIVE